MKPFAHVLSTVVVVAAGIAVHDLVVVGRRDAAPVGALREVESSAPTSAPRAAEATAPAALLGSGEAHWRAALERRLAALERHEGARREASTGPGPARTDGESGGASTEPPDVGAARSAGERTTSTEEGDPVRPEEVRRFRQVLEAAEREIVIEKATRQVHDFLDKVGAKLTDEQRRSVVGTALKFQGRWREMSKEPPKGEAQTQERKDAYTRVMAEFEQEIRGAVPGVEADIIIDGIRRAGKEPQK